MTTFSVPPPMMGTETSTFRTMVRPVLNAGQKRASLFFHAKIGWPSGRRPSSVPSRLLKLAISVFMFSNWRGLSTLGSSEGPAMESRPNTGRWEIRSCIA